MRRTDRPTTDFRLSARCTDIYLPLRKAVDIVRIYKIPQTDPLLTLRPTLAHRILSSARAHSDHQPRKAFSQDGWLIDNPDDDLRPRAALFQRHSHLAIPAREGESGGLWQL